MGDDRTDDPAAGRDASVGMPSAQDLEPVVFLGDSGAVGDRDVVGDGRSDSGAAGV